MPQKYTESDDANAGTAIHRYLETRDLSAVEDDEIRARCAAIDMSIIPQGAQHEVAISYDVEADTAEIVPVEGRDYPHDGRRFFMRLDLIGRLPSAAFVADFKTGEKKRHARESLQLRIGALAVARLIGVDAASVAMLYLRHDGQWYTDRAEFDAFDLVEIREQLLAIRARVIEAHQVVADGGIPTLRPGPHCEYCPAAPVCPVVAGIGRELARREPESVGDWFAGLAVDEAGRIAEQAWLVEKLAGVVKDAAKDWVRAHGELPLPSGRRIAIVERKVQTPSALAKEELAATKKRLQDDGLFDAVTTTQIRIVGARTK